MWFHSQKVISFFSQATLVAYTAQGFHTAHHHYKDNIPQRKERKKQEERRKQIGVKKNLHKIRRRGGIEREKRRDGGTHA
jgi:hypothetical protein